MNYQHQSLREQLAREYVLGTMTYLVRKRFERLLLNDVALRAQVNTLQNKFYPLYAELPESAPHTRIWQGIQARLGFAPAQTSMGFTLRFWRNFAMLNLLFALGIGALLFKLSAPQPQLLALLAAANQSPMLLAQANGAELAIQTLAPLSIAADKSLELWLIQGSHAPQSLGLLPSNGKKVIPIPAHLQAAIAADSVLAVSLEPQGGSPTHQPTGTVLFSGAWRII